MFFLSFSHPPFHYLSIFLSFFIILSHILPLSFFLPFVFLSSHLPSFIPLFPRACWHQFRFQITTFPVIQTRSGYWSADAPSFSMRSPTPMTSLGSWSHDDGRANGHFEDNSHFKCWRCWSCTVGFKCRGKCRSFFFLLVLKVGCFFSVKILSLCFYRPVSSSFVMLSMLLLAGDVGTKRLVT